MAAAAVSVRFGDRFGFGNVILAASVVYGLGLLVGGFARPGTALATTTRGIGLLIGRLAVGASVDLFHPWLEQTEGSAAVWPTVTIPVLAVIPLVALLADAERGIRARTAAGSDPGPAG